MKYNDISQIIAPINVVMHMIRESGLRGELVTILDTYIAITSRILRTVHPKHLREAAQLVEIQARIKGRPVDETMFNQALPMQAAIEYLKMHDVRQVDGTPGVEVNGRLITSEELVEALEKVRGARVGEVDDVAVSA